MPLPASPGSDVAADGRSRWCDGGRACDVDCVARKGDENACDTQEDVALHLIDSCNCVSDQHLFNSFSVINDDHDQGVKGTMLQHAHSSGRLFIIRLITQPT